jgi:predicted transglutaminase-like cysteine proteinase
MAKDALGAEHNPITSDVSPRAAFEKARQNTVSLNRYTFKPIDMDNVGRQTGLSGMNLRLLEKSLSSYERYLSTEFDLKYGPFDPARHDNIDPRTGQAAYTALKTEIQSRLQNNLPELTAQMPPALRNDKTLQMAAMVDAMVDSRIKQNENADSFYWSDDYNFHPFTTVERGEGDCDDFAILKRKLLIEMGVPSNQVYLMAGYDGKSGSGHMTCVVVGDDGKSYVIDNGSSGKPVLTPLDDYIKKYDFQPMMIMRGDEVFVLPQTDYEQTRRTVEKTASLETAQPVRQASATLAPSQQATT